MIVVTATMWPLGSQAQSYEMLTTTITNTTADELATRDSYSAHVISRPNKFLGIEGYEADVEVRDHERSRGLTPLFMAILGAAHQTDSSKGVILPAANTLARMTIQEIAEFEDRLKGRR